MDLALAALRLVGQRAFGACRGRQRGRRIVRWRRQFRAEHRERGRDAAGGVGCGHLHDQRIAGPQVHAVPVHLAGRVQGRADRPRERRILEHEGGRGRLVAGLHDHRRVGRDGRRGDDAAVRLP